MRHRDELRKSIDGNVVIRRLARNPVMLTAISVLYWNRKQLPDQRAELYQSILEWLAVSRSKKPGRLPPNRALGIFQELAWATRRSSRVSRARKTSPMPPEPKWLVIS